MNKALQLLSLARKGGRIEAGEEPVDTCIRMGRARLILLASDASEHTCRRIRGSVASSKQPYITIPFTKEELGGAIGRSAIAVAALTDPALAQAFIRALDDPAQYTDLLAGLDKRVTRIRKHQKEGKAQRPYAHGKK